MKTREPVVLAGTAFERGQQHGRALMPYVVEAVDRFKYQIEHVTHLDPSLVVRQFVATTKLMETAACWTPHLMQELQGLAEATAIPLDDLFVLQCQDEIQWWFRQFSSGTPDENERCSTIGLDPTGRRPALVAQNLDHLGIYDGLECLFHYKYADSNLECLVPSFAGLLALNGLNCLGVGVVCNALHKYLNNRRDGLGVTFVLRAILEQPTLEKALAFVGRVPHASGQSYIIGDRGGVVGVECSANQVAPFVPAGAPGRVWHTNHPLSSSDVCRPATAGPDAGTTFGRLEYLEARLGRPGPEIGPETLKLILSSHQGAAPICVHHACEPDRHYTLASAVCVLAEKPELHLSFGPPCIDGYRVFCFGTRGGLDDDG